MDLLPDELWLEILSKLTNDEFAPVRHTNHAFLDIALSIIKRRKRERKIDSISITTGSLIVTGGLSSNIFVSGNLLSISSLQNSV